MAVSRLDPRHPLYFSTHLQIPPHDTSTLRSISSSSARHLSENVTSFDDSLCFIRGCEWGTPEILEVLEESRFHEGTSGGNRFERGIEFRGRRVWFDCREEE
jgi:hypothetical protein